NDIQRNLSAPLSEIGTLADELGEPLPQITTAVRTGDTKATERRKQASKPPHILITTPESLNILLTSRSGREGLRHVKTLILDEIHAVADDKRGSHLSLSVERLCALAEGHVTRIGLSATQRPLKETARLLVGSHNIDDEGMPNCRIVDIGHSRKLDLAVELPSADLGPIATHELWAENLDVIADLVRSHGTTLVFVNTRRLVERVARQLTERLGEDAVVAHHGSLARATRFAAEEKLKHGDVKACVTTASLELGIDIGVVDLVCQIGSPRSIAILLQRIGRSGHTLGAIPKGRLFPLTRDELVECAALCRAIRNDILDTLKIPQWPLDVLAQQIVAACSVEEWEEDALFELVRRAYPYRDLPRESFDSVVEMLWQGFAPREGRNRALLHRDGVGRILKGRRGAGIAALTNGGAIPENADYDVLADPEGTFVGTVNEDFAIESMAGDVFLLGNTPWKIRRIESGKVRVEDAQGQAPTIPFWLGEAPGRTWELSEEISTLKEGVEERLGPANTVKEWIASECSVSAEAGRQIVEYLEEGKRVLGMVPTARRIVAERFFDESGGMQLVIHSPFGARINRAWGMALRKSICRTFDFELQAAATDDGINFSLGPNLSFPLDEVFTYLSSSMVEDVLKAAILQAPMFVTRWRWNATRALAILRFSGGGKVPAPLQRMRSDDLLAAVFPAQVQCQDNRFDADIELPDHPLVFETIRDCLTEASDIEGLAQVLSSIEREEIEVYARDTVQPSVFSHQILNAMPYAFLDDAPLEERRARAVSLRRALPEHERELGSLDLASIEQESQNAWPSMRDSFELLDALSSLGLLLEAEVRGAKGTVSQEQLEAMLDRLVQEGRAFRIKLGDGSSGWTGAERASRIRAASPDAVFAHEAVDIHHGEEGPTREEAVLELIRGRVECVGPVTPEGLAGGLHLDPSPVALALAQLEAEGVVLRGRFTPGVLEEEFCNRRILARIHRATISQLRRQVEPVSQSTFLQYLFRWQHVGSPRQVSGEGGILEVIGQLQGYESAAGAWEREILPTRVADYRASTMDLLSLRGEVVWGRFDRSLDNGNLADGHSALTRATPIGLALRDSLDWLLAPVSEDAAPGNGGASEILAFLRRRGASFMAEIVSGTRRLAADVEEMLWQLAAAGWVTSDGMEPLRHRIAGNSNNGRRGIRRRRELRRRNTSYSRWSILQPIAPSEERVEAHARQLLRRYGVLCAELLARESLVPRWRDLVHVLRQMEMRGEIRGGRFVAGLVGEQFAFPEAIEMLRQVKNQGPTGERAVISACDPLNLVGILTPGERVPAVLGNKVGYRDGVLTPAVELGYPAVETVDGSNGVEDPASVVKAPTLS
ncbi:MAG: DEAD/DEAH box helicase, partial [Dehalococcoidia bacterium]|nr:DEAD/DEAH box helicase [Dehalococcoidia bacterium]